MAALIYEHAGVRTFYDAESGRIFGLDEMLGPKQHRSSCETYPDGRQRPLGRMDKRMAADLTVSCRPVERGSLL